MHVHVQRSITSSSNKKDIGPRHVRASWSALPPDRDDMVYSTRILFALPFPSTPANLRSCSHVRRTANSSPLCAVLLRTTFRCLDSRYPSRKGLVQCCRKMKQVETANGWREGGPAGASVPYALDQKQTATHPKACKEFASFRVPSGASYLYVHVMWVPMIWQ
jgi:hypothetical protein